MALEVAKEKDAMWKNVNKMKYREDKSGWLWSKKSSYAHRLMGWAVGNL